MEVGNNVKVDVIFYEYLHNEFKRSFVEMHFKLCDLILKDPYLSRIIRKSGLVKCPIPPCLKIIPERASVTYVNKSYFPDLSINVRRKSRRGDYIVNLEITSNVWIGNNVTLDLIFYEYLHNEFRRSFVEMHFKACDVILKDLYVGNIFRRGGLDTCPIPPGKMSFRNVNLNMDIPSVWPFEKGNVVMTATDAVAGVVMAEGEIVLTFKQK